MSAIQPKKGKCVDCGSSSAAQYLTAKRCQLHYWAHRRKVNADKAKENTAEHTDKLAQERALNLWFDARIRQLPKHCQECGEYLNPYVPWGARAYVAHVLPKRIFESVKTHPDNCVYLCIQCHTNYDNWGNDKIVLMKIFPLVLCIILQLMKHVQHGELKSMPQYVVDHLNNEL